jgi:hypothetical protein
MQECRDEGLDVLTSKASFENFQDAMDLYRIFRR